MTAQHSYSSKRVKSLLALLLATSLLAGSPLPAHATAPNQLSISINGDMQFYPQPPMMIDDRVYIPVRALFESLGFDVQWQEEQSSVLANRRIETLRLDLEEKSVVYTNPFTFEQTTDVPIKIVEGRTMIPVRLVSELLGLEVGWNAAERHVQITAGKHALFEALMSQDQHQVRTLLEQGTDPNSKKASHSALQYAVAMRDMSSAGLLLEKGAVIGEDDLMIAIKGDDAELLHWLLTSSKLEKTPAQLATGLLTTAIRYQSVEMPKVLLAVGADPNQHDEFNDSPLHLAIRDQNTETIQDLLTAGADPNTPTKVNQPLLIDAVTRGNLSITKLLLSHKADPNAAASDGWTPLMVAAEHGNALLIQTLLASGADVHAVNKHGGTALAIAQAHGNTDSIRFLTNAGAKDPAPGKLPDTALFRNVSKVPTNEPLIAAVIRGETNRVLQLLSETSADINDFYSQAILKYSAVSANVETTKMLLAHYPDISLEFVWRDVYFGGNEEIFRILLEYEQSRIGGVRVDHLNKIAAEQHGNLALYQTLFETGVPSGMNIHKDISPLRQIAYDGYTEIARLLLKHGADPNHVDEDSDETALDTAVRRGHPETLKVLLTSDKLTQETKDYALLAAVKRGSLEMVNLLLKSGANARFQTPDGDSPIELAEWSGHTKMIELLN